MADLIGQTIHGCEIREKIGEGGYGAVYKAYQSAVDREVAIKVILPEHASKPDFAQRFETEARLVAKLEHPHIVPLYDYWRDEGCAYLMMRWLPTSLRAALQKQNALSLAQTARLLDQIGDALAVAHQAGVIHRDLKPDNILLDERGNAYLTDFGIAKQLDGSDHITGTDAIVGTLAYLAPEQIQNGTLSAQTDIYALGVMLFELLAGQHPFTGTPPAMLVMRHLQDPLPSLIEKRPEVSPAVDAVIQKATAKNPADRYNDALAVASDFRAAAQLTPGAPIVVQSGAKVIPLQEAQRSPATPEQRNRHNMLQNVQRFWVEGVLENSLHGAALIELGMKQSAGTVDHAWDTLLRKPGSPDETLPSGTEILDVFDRLNGKLLILGDPGGGKTTTLLELARDLLFRAEADEAHPIPVIFNLSSWSESRKPLAEWLVDELSSKYQVPKKVAQEWVEGDALLLLLDGLDEVALEQREACVQAINAYRAEHGFVDVVVCSRIADYEALTNRLKLNGAIVIQPLGDLQVDHYLASFGPEMDTVRRMLMNDSTLRELACSPLMLSIMALAYRGASTGDVPKLDTPEAQRKHIFDVYVRRMFERRVGEKPYTEEQTVHYLSWLARKMQEHAQSVFQIEKLQPTWLTEKQRQQYEKTAWSILLPYNMLFYGVPFVFAGPFLGVSGWLMGVLLGVAGLVLAWVYGTGLWKLSSGQLIGGLAFGIGWGMSFGLGYNLLAGIMVGVVTAISYISLLRLVSRFLGIQNGNQNQIVIVELLQFSWQKVNIWLGAAGFGAGVFAVGGIYLFWLSFVGGELPLLNVVVGLIAGGIVLMIPILLQSGLTSGEVEMRTQPNQGIRSTATNAHRAALANALTFALLGLLGYVPVTSLSYGLALGIPQGLYTGASYWLLYGGGAVIWHLALRRVLYGDGAIPQNYARFLDYAASLIFLRKVGGGYIFVHRYLLEYFAGIEQSPQ